MVNKKCALCCASSPGSGSKSRWHRITRSLAEDILCYIQKILPEGQYICTICRAKLMKVKSADLKNDNTEIDITINQRGKNSVELKTLTNKNCFENFTRNS